MRTNAIDCEHFLVTSQLYTREMLENAAAASRSIAEVVRRLGAKQVGGTEAYIGRRLREYGIDTSHFESVSRRKLKDIPHSQLVTAVAESRSIAAVAKTLGVSDNTSFRLKFRKLVEVHGLDLSHMLGQAHARGVRGKNRTNPEELLVADPTVTRRVKAHRLRAALIDIGIPYRCQMCATGPVWQGHEITLEVDHVNGDHSDNRPENLRFLCPNCHATTPTFCRKKPSSGSDLDG